MSAGANGAAPRELLKMSELAERTGVSPGTIRYYLREGLLGDGADVLRTSRNMAYYPPDDVERIALIRRLQEERFMPLRVIRGALQEDPERVHALIELEDRILERALASAEDRRRVSRKAVEQRYGVPRNVLQRLAAPRGGIDGDAQVVDDLLLSDVILEGSRTQGCAVDFIFERSVDPDQPFAVIRRRRIADDLLAHITHVDATAA